MRMSALARSISSAASICESTRCWASRSTMVRRCISQRRLTRAPAAPSIGTWLAAAAEALEQLGADVARPALAAKVNGREVDLAARLEPADEAGDAVVEIEPILPATLEGLGVLRHSTAHLLAAAVLDLFPGTKLGI